MSIRILCAAALLLPGLLSGQTGVKLSEKDLPEQQRDWLRLVAYHIQPVERDVFFRLGSDRDRDFFIQAFWNQRDPTPGTPENEYRDELEKRFAYCNKFYGRSSVREGWQTDMGRIHMILGPPVGIERFEVSPHIVPCQAWTYYGDPRKELPTLFILLFYQRGGAGDFKLYDPVVDGPYQLLMNKRDIDPLDYEALYEQIREIAPTLADSAISLVPGEYGFGLTPSPRNTMILADIFESPKKDVNPAYATHFLDYRGLVSTEYMTNYVDSAAWLALIRDPATGLPFLHFSMVPQSVTVDIYEPKAQYYCAFRVDVSLRRGEDIVFQYAREFPVYFDEAEKDRLLSNGIAIEDSFPVVEGRYKLVVLLQNAVGKEFSLLEREIDVPAEERRPRLGGLHLGYGVQTYPSDLHLPFKIGDRKLLVDPKGAIAAAENVHVLFTVEGADEALRRTGEVRIEVAGLRETDPVRKSYRLRLGDPAGGRGLVLHQAIPAAELAPDYYEITATLASADGEALDAESAKFIVSPQAALGHPIANARGVPLSGRPIYYYMLAEQHDRRNENDRARARYEEAFRLGPGYREGVVRFGAFLLETGDFDRALEIAAVLKADEKARFEGFALAGRALLGRERFADALPELLEANKIYNSDVRVLNALGICYHRTGQDRQALDVLDASLRLVPDQPEVRKLADEIRRRGA